MKKKRILILAPYFPWPLSFGGNVAMYHLMVNLSERFDITFISSFNKMNKKENLEILKMKMPKVDFQIYSYKKADNMAYEFSKKLQRRLDTKIRFGRFAKKYDLMFMGEITPDYLSFINNVIKERQIEIVQVEFFSYLPFVYALPSSVKKIFIHHELRYVINEKRFNGNDVPSLFLKNYLKSFEINTLNYFDTIVTLSSVDKIKLEKQNVSTPIVVSPCLVAVDVPPQKESTFHNDLVFVGSSAHSPNKLGLKWFVESVFPLLKKENLNLRLKVIGNWPLEDQKELCQNNQNITFLGFVNDLGVAIKDCIMIVPINMGSGIRMKILEAAMHSVPVVSTTIGIEGLNFERNKDCFIEDTPEGFAQKIVELAKDPLICEKICKSAYNTFMEKYSPQVLCDLRASIYSSL